MADEIKVGVAGIIAVLLIVFGALFIRVKLIEDGEAGVKFRLGKIQEEAVGTGWNFYLFMFTRIEKWNIKTQELKETANVPSSEGLISTLDISVLFYTPKENVTKIRRAIGQNYVSTVVEPYVRESIRNIASGYQVKALYSEEGRKEVSSKMLDFLRSKLEEKGIIVQDVLLRDVRLPPAFLESIERKLKTEQESLQKEFELIKAKKDAEIEVARARGVAKSNRIIAKSVDANYLRYVWVKGLATPNTSVVYVPTEANLPILESQRWNEERQKGS
ncbi:MAG: prohibitin family protein [Chlamydiae bacterium]|nr:prohibitin family protein [Chlamydiota bacterium]MBI3265968.1 prohibitin family protein [Chlamydiota bacterium]